MNVRLLIIIIIVLSFIVILFGDDNKDIESEKIPDMPLYSAIIAGINDDMFPSVKGSISPMLSLPLEGIDWTDFKYDTRLREFSSKKFEDGIIFLLQFSDEQQEEIIYFNGKESYKFLLDTSYNNVLLGNKNSALLLYWSYPTEIYDILAPGTFIIPEDFEYYPGVRKFFTYELSVDNKLISKEIEQQDGLIDNSILVMFTDISRPDITIAWPYDPYKGEILHSMKLEMENYDMIDIYGLQTEKFLFAVKKAFVDDNFELLMYEKAIYDKTNESWSVTPINIPWTAKIFSDIFEDFWLEDIYHVPTFKIWYDGSIIYNAQYIKTVGNETAYLNCILHDKGGDVPELLIWSLYYDYEDELLYDKWREYRNETFDRYFFPSSNDNIMSTYDTTEMMFELLFDVDRENHSVIYLRGGQPWLFQMQ